MSALRDELAPLFGTLLSYPEGDSARVAACRIARLAPEASGPLGRFLRETENAGTARLEQAYDATFDLNPRCIPYLSVHAFGEESFKRAELMTALAERYETEGFDAAGELSDHLAVVLRFAPRFAAEEWEEFVELLLRPSLERMGASLSSSRSPYRHVLDALSAVLASSAMRENAHA